MRSGASEHHGAPGLLTLAASTAAVAVLAGCTADTTGSRAQPPRSVRDLGKDYAFTVRAGCGEREGFSGYDRVTVRNGRVVTATPLDLPTAVIPPHEAYSIGGLVDRGRAAKAQGAEHVVVQRSRDKTVRRVVIDRNVAAIDDEECYAISHLVTSAEAAPRRGDRLRSLHPVARRSTDGRIYLRTRDNRSCPAKPIKTTRIGTARLEVVLTDHADSYCSQQQVAFRSLVPQPDRKTHAQVPTLLLRRGGERLVLPVP